MPKMMAVLISDFSWRQLLMGEESWGFLLEVGLRTVIMYIVILFSLKILGKRSIRQLSIFDLVVIIGLGSAAGDPMFYKEVGLISAVFVFLVIIIIYRLTTTLVARSRQFEKIIEGTCTCLINKGVFAIEDFKREPLAQDEFYAELRQQSVWHLGQVEMATIEVSGQISVYFYPDEEVKYGLPIIPGTADKAAKEISKPGYYACTFCGYTEKLEPVAALTCKACNHTKWVEASNKKRVA